MGEKLYGESLEDGEMMCISGIVEDYQFDQWFQKEGYNDYPYETLGTCSLSGSPARFADIPLPDRDGKK